MFLAHQEAADKKGYTSTLAKAVIGEEESRRQNQQRLEWSKFDLIMLHLS
jgi:hypothetical protein